MRIVVNDIAASTGGALSVLKDFYNTVKETDTENEWIFLLGDRFFEETDNVKIITLPEIKASRIKKLYFDLFSGRKFIGNLNPDVVVSFQNVLTFGIKCPQVLCIHQIIPFQNTKKFSFLKSNERALAIIQYLIGALIKISAKKADAIITQTFYARELIAKVTHVDIEKIHAFHPSVNLAPVDKEKYDFKRFFYPTAPSVYKNNACIEKACEILYSRGIKDFSVELTVDNANHPAISSVGYVQRDELYKKYSVSVLLFPSYIETYAYPLAEGRRAGGIVLASDMGFSREVLEGYKNGYFFDPFNPEELADLMEKVIKGEIELEPREENWETENTWLQVMEVIKSQGK